MAARSMAGDMSPLVRAVLPVARHRAAYPGFAGDAATDGASGRRPRPTFGGADAGAAAEGGRRCFAGRPVGRRPPVPG